MQRGRNVFDRKRSRWTSVDEEDEPTTSRNSDLRNRLTNRRREERDRKNFTRFPRNLSGKEIGMYYAMKSKENRRKNLKLQEPDVIRVPTGKKKRKMIEIVKPLGVILLSDQRRNEIRTLLKNNKCCNIKVLTKDLTYVKDSEFKREYLKIVSGTFESKLSDTSLRKALYSNDISDTNFYNVYIAKQTNAIAKDIFSSREKLPCYHKRLEIIDLIKNNQIVVICGETGCGKTTQVPQYILDDFILSKKGSTCKIYCTQPRRISAISVAERVAVERCEKLGATSSVGYHIRLEKTLPRETGSITYCTTGILLKLMENNPSLSGISHLILDEIHERDVTSDFVITLLKMIIIQRPDLKLILMSATLNAEQFSKYYNNCAIINVPGFTHPVQVHYLEDALATTKYNFEPYREIKGWRKHLRCNKMKQQSTDEFRALVEPYVRTLQAKKKYTSQVCNNLLNPNSENIDAKLIVALIKYICNTSNPDASILVFVPGFTEICRITMCLADSKCFPSHRFLIIKLHSKLPSIEQRKVFEKPPKGVRKIVIATNIAETSITIDDIVYVIDTGKIKMKSYDVEEDLEALKNEWVTAANANQRKGRAGRVQAGVCYQLFSRPRYFNLQSYPLPEVQRTRLETIILTLKILQLGKAEDFLNKLMDPPAPKAIENGIRLLRQMNALDAEENLTPLGCHLAKLPVHPRMGKMILLGALFSCLDPILSIAASLDFKDAFQYPVDKQQAVNERKQKLLSGWNSDHLVLAEAIRLFEISIATGKERDFCRDYFLSRHTLDLLCKMKEQFTEYLYEMKFITNKGVKSREWNQNSKNFSLIKAIVCAGLYPNVAVIRKVNKKGRKIIRTIEDEKVVLSTNSINSSEKKFDSPLLVYHMKQKLTQINLFDTSMVHPLPLLFFGDEIKMEPFINEHGQVSKKKPFAIISLSNMLRFKCKKETAFVIQELRAKLDDLLAYKITHPGCISWLEEKFNPEVKIMKAIMELITSEDLGEIDIETDADLRDIY